MKQNKGGRKEKIIIGLKKAHSSLERIIETMESENSLKNKNGEDKCFSIIQQNLSVMGLLKSVNISILKNHLDLYIKKVQQGKMNKANLTKMKEEILKTVKQAQDK